MIGTTLGDIRDYIEALASDEGEYSLVCGRYGDQPVPAADLRFESRPTARAAAQATEQYRAALRRYDPQLPYYDVIVQQASRPHDVTEQPHQRLSDTDADDCGLSSLGLETERKGPEHRELVEFCHRGAATVFETLSAEGYDAVETAVMDAYFDLAETISDPDTLCLCLLESMAAELDMRLAPGEQRDVLAGAAGRLPTPPADEEPIESTFTHLQEFGILGSYTRSPWSTALDDGTRSVVVQFSEYVLSPQNGRLPVLPIILDFSRRPLDWPPSTVRVTDAGDGWRVRLVLAHEAAPEGLASVPIQSGEP
jgi:hypothetical protein